MLAIVGGMPAPRAFFLPPRSFLASLAGLAFPTFFCLFALLGNQALAQAAQGFRELRSMMRSGEEIRAMKGLVHHGEAGAREIAKALDSKRVAVRNSAAFHLGEMGEVAAFAVPKLVDRVPFAEAPQFATVADYLREETVFLHLFSVEQEEDRASKKSLKEYGERLDRGSAEDALMRLGTTSLEGVLVRLERGRGKLGQATEEYVDLRLLFALIAAQAGPSAVPLVERTLAEGTESQRAAALLAAGALVTTALSLLDEVTKVAEDDQSPLRWRAVEARMCIAWTPADAARLVDDEDPIVAALVAASLYRDQPDDPVRWRRVIDMLENGTPRVKRVALALLAEVEPEFWFEADGILAVMVAARAGLLLPAYEPAPVLPEAGGLVFALMSDRDPSLQALAVRAAFRLDPAQPALHQALQKMAKKRDPYLRQTARFVQANIDAR